MDEDDFVAALGARIRRLRRDAGRTLEELAEAAEIDISYLGALERGTKGNPSLRVVVRIANALNLSVASLANVTAEGSTKSALRTDARRAIQNLDEDGLRRLIRVVEALR